MVVQGLPLNAHVYEEGSEDVATLSQVMRWDVAPVVARASCTSFQPLGGVTVTGSASTSMVASSTSPAATPEGLGAVPVWVAVVSLTNTGTGEPVTLTPMPGPGASRLALSSTARLRTVIVPDRAGTHE